MNDAVAVVPAVTDKIKIINKTLNKIIKILYLLKYSKNDYGIFVENGTTSLIKLNIVFYVVGVKSLIQIDLCVRIFINSKT